MTPKLHELKSAIVEWSSTSYNRRDWSAQFRDRPSGSAKDIAWQLQTMAGYPIEGYGEPMNVRLEPNFDGDGGYTLTWESLSSCD